MNSSEQMGYRGHSFEVEAVKRGDESWESRYRVDFAQHLPADLTFGPRNITPLDPCWATPTEALTHATELAHAAIDAFERLESGDGTAADPGLRDLRLTLRYVLQTDDGYERQLECLDMADVLNQLGKIGPRLRHAFVLDAAGTTVLEAGHDDRHQRERPDHADWPQTE